MFSRERERGREPTRNPIQREPETYKIFGNRSATSETERKRVEEVERQEGRERESTKHVKNAVALENKSSLPPQLPALGIIHKVNKRNFYINILHRNKSVI